MNTKMFWFTAAIFFFVATLVMAQTPTEICMTSFGYLPGSPTNDLLCNTQSHFGTNGYDCAATQVTLDGKLVWVWKITDPAALTHIYLVFGNATNRFSLHNRVLKFGVQGKTDKWYDGMVLELSFDSTDGINGTWNEFTTYSGSILSPPYNETMKSGSPFVGKKAWTGTIFQTEQTIIADASMLSGSDCLFRLHFASDSAVGNTTGLNIFSFKTLGGNIAAPENPKAMSGNSSLCLLSIQRNQDEDRCDHSVYEYQRNGGPWVSLGIITIPYQITGVTPEITLANGDNWIFRVTDYDVHGSDGDGPVTFEPAPLVPTASGKPGMTLLTMDATGGHWVQQTAEVPTGSEIGPVDGYFVYRPVTPNGPLGTAIASGGSTMLAFYDSDQPAKGEVFFYRVLSIKNGITEPRCYGNCP